MRSRGSSPGSTWWNPGSFEVSKWRPRSELEAAAANTVWCGVARKTA